MASSFDYAATQVANGGLLICGPEWLPTPYCADTRSEIIYRPTPLECLDLVITNEAISITLITSNRLFCVPHDGLYISYISTCITLHYGFLSQGSFIWFTYWLFLWILVLLISRLGCNLDNRWRPCAQEGMNSLVASHPECHAWSTQVISDNDLHKRLLQGYASIDWSHTHPQLNTRMHITELWLR